MSFMILKLLFAVLALALLVVIGVIVRKIARRKQVGAPRPPRAAAAKTPKMRAPGLAKKPAPVPEPEPEEPAPARRRQLQTFAEAERSAAEAEAVVLPVAAAESEIEPEIDTLHEPVPEPAIEPAIAPVIAEPIEPASDEPAWDEPAAAEPAAGYTEAVLARLEEAFEALQAGEIALPAYRDRLLAEQAAVGAHVASIEHGEDGDALEAALSAQDAVNWCLDWADEQDSVAARGE